MTNTPPTEQEMTDVFSRFPDSTSTLPQPGDDRIKISDQKKAAIATAAVLLGGGATFAAVNAGLIADPFGGTGNETLDDGPVKTPGTPEETKTATPVAHNAMSLVENGSITPSENIQIAQRVEPTMTFGEAYAAARAEVGTGGIFSWRGEVYNTYTVEEWQGLSLTQRQEFLSDVGYRTSQQNQIGYLTEDEPDFYEFTIDGRPALGIDDDHDGVADAILFLDERTNDLIAFVDIEGDDRIDSVLRIDMANQQVIGQDAIEEPFLVDVQRLESWGNITATAHEPAVSDLSFTANEDKTFEDDIFDDNHTDDSGYVNDAEMPEMD